MSAPEHSEQDGIRLSKRLAEQLGCSRREAEIYIENGAVQVDGLTVEALGSRVRPEQTVTVREGAKLQEAPPVTLLLHKPAGYTVRNPQGGRGHTRGKVGNAYDLLVPDNLAAMDTPAPLLVLDKHFRNLECLLPVPVPASGLMVFTQDHRVARKLQEDALHLEQECIVQVRGNIDEDGLERLCNGTAIDGKRLPRIKVSWQNETHLRFALKGIFPEEIAEMCECVGLEVTGMKRLRIGRISLAKLPEGQWRYAMPWEKF
ncbi:MAG: RNA-binding protein [Acidovorax sp.]|jgi:23S rRNA pseudouridine2604 synthase|nr:RNA-binding protein [Acidovorax sp.]